MTSMLIVLSIFVLALLLRVVPHMLSPHGSGVDHWFWKAYIQEYRRSGEFPPRLPQYILDEHQWYPPAFPLLMAHLPAHVFDRFNNHIAVIIDLLRMALLAAIAAWMTEGSTSAIVIAALVYATIPIQISYNIQLNPRGLAALLLDGLLMLLVWVHSYRGPVWLWAVVMLLAGMILLTHKMTTQLLWFIALGCAVLYRDWRFAAILPGSIVVALVMSRGFYVSVLRAHWDIVRFWARHWRWIGADPVRESPIYGEPDYERAEKLHPSGLRGFLRQCFVLAGFSPAAWVACLLVYERLFMTSPFLIYPTYLLVWLLLMALLAVLTTFVRPFKAIGAGYLYMYNASLVASLLIALTWRYTRQPQVSQAVVLCALLANSLGVAWYYRTFTRNKRWSIDDDFARMLELLKSLPSGVVMCLPASWYDAVAFKTGKPVLYGAHGYGFKLLEPTFPRLLIPFDEIISRYAVRYLLTMDGALTDRCKADLPAAQVISVGTYHLYRFDEA